MIPRIKICGMTRVEDAELAVSLGAWALGFIFYPKSPRFIPYEKARRITDRASMKNVKKIGVFVNEDPSAIEHAVEVSGIDGIQLHGFETPTDCQRLKERLPHVTVIKALRLYTQDLFSAQSLIRSFRSSCQGILLDTYLPEKPLILGGTGVVGDWELAAQVSKAESIILAGGLNPENIQAAIQQVQPDAIDASSGLEDAPGIKSHKKLNEFFQNGLKI